MSNLAETRGELVKLLEDAFSLSEQLRDPVTGYLIERALDEARAQQFRLQN
jgi:hypothetical protein